MPSQKTPERKRGIYLLPNLLTSAGLFAGFYAIVSAMRGDYSSASLAVFIAMIADGLDGRIARLTNTESEFGAQYDSLSDMVAFGVTPALVMYSWSLFALGKIGWLAAFVYCAAGGLRLARFNTQSHAQDKRYFQGLAIPAGAGAIASSVWLASDNGISGTSVSWFAATLTVLIALLMVSNIRFYSFKDLDFRGKVPFVTVLTVVLILVLVSINPPLVLFAVFISYAFSGPVLTIISRNKRRKQRRLRSAQRKNEQ